jgi:multidrug efflux system membrane fusion protein
MTRSVLIALVIAMALALWLASGQLPQLGRAADPAAPPPQPLAARPAEPPLMRVQVRESVGAPIERVILLNGRTAPARRVELRAEIAGRVVELPVERGGQVEAGEVIARLDRRDREAWLQRAEAMLLKAQADHDAASSLRQRQFVAENELVARRAALEEARATVERTRLDLAHTEIRAPFAGILDRRPIELGDFLDTGDVVGTVLEQDPLLVVGDVAEVDARGLRPGLAGRARLVTGEEVDGKVRYIAREADAATRTFRLELEVPNPGGRLPAGTSAEIRLPLDPVPAHEVSPALLVLDDDGALGVRAVDEGGIVRFHPVSIVRAGPDAVWLAGLPERLRLITVGQGFVRAGQRVLPVPEPTVAGGAA